MSVQPHGRCSYCYHLNRITRDHRIGQHKWWTDIDRPHQWGRCPGSRRLPSPTYPVILIAAEDVASLSESEAWEALQDEVERLARHPPTQG